MLELKNISFKRDNKQILDNVSLKLDNNNDSTGDDVPF